MIATGVQIHDRETGKDYALCDTHHGDWTRDYPEMFGTGLGETLGRLVTIGPWFGEMNQDICPACNAGRAA